MRVGGESALVFTRQYKYTPGGRAIGLALRGLGYKGTLEFFFFFFFTQQTHTLAAQRTQQNSISVATIFAAVSSRARPGRQQPQPCTRS